MKKTALIPQGSFRFRSTDDKAAFRKALADQPHISSGTFFFQSCAYALIEAAKAGETVQWPIKFVTKKSKSR